LYGDARNCEYRTGQNEFSARREKAEKSIVGWKLIPSSIPEQHSHVIIPIIEWRWGFEKMPEPIRGIKGGLLLGSDH